jgi:hypothetical protein
MKKTITTIAAAGLLLAGAAAPASAASTKIVWKDRLLLRVEGGQCEANGFTAPSYNVWVVPTLLKAGNKWIPTENILVNVLLDEGGEPCV